MQLLCCQRIGEDLAEKLDSRRASSPWSATCAASGPAPGARSWCRRRWRRKSSTWASRRRGYWRRCRSTSSSALTWRSRRPERLHDLVQLDEGSGVQLRRDAQWRQRARGKVELAVRRQPTGGQTSRCRDEPGSLDPHQRPRSLRVLEGCAQASADSSCQSHRGLAAALLDASLRRVLKIDDDPVKRDGRTNTVLGAQRSDHNTEWAGGLTVGTHCRYTESQIPPRGRVALLIGKHKAHARRPGSFVVGRTKTRSGEKQSITWQAVRHQRIPDCDAALQSEFACAVVGDEDA